MPSFTGTRSDYSIAATASGGVVLKSAKYGSSTVNHGEEIHFHSDDRDYRVQNGALVELDGPLGGTTQTAAIEARWPGLVAALGKAAKG